MRCCVSCLVVSKSQRLLVVVAHVTWGNSGIAQKNGTLQIPRLADKEAASGRPSGNRKRRACEEQLSPLSGARVPAGPWAERERDSPNISPTPQRKTSCLRGGLQWPSQRQGKEEGTVSWGSGRACPPRSQMGRVTGSLW